MKLFVRVKCDDRCSSSLALRLSLGVMDCFFGCFFGRTRENTSLLCLIFFFGFLQTKNKRVLCVSAPSSSFFSLFLFSQRKTSSLTCWRKKNTHESNNGEKDIRRVKEKEEEEERKKGLRRRLLRKWSG